MSIVVGVRREGRIVVAADSLVSFGDAQHFAASNAVARKIRRLVPGGPILGATGWGVYDGILEDYLRPSSDGAPPPLLTLASPAEIFSFFLEFWRAMRDRYTFVNDQAQGKDSPFADLDSTFLVASTGGLFKVSHDLDVTPFEQFCAIGSGSEYALGAMSELYDRTNDPATVARAGVRAAVRFDGHCGGATHLEELYAGSDPSSVS